MQHRNTKLNVGCELGAVVCVCGPPMPPIGPIAAVHNNLNPLRADAERKGGSQERQMRDREKQGREGRNNGQ